jgi:hypothetical protein
LECASISITLQKLRHQQTLLPMNADGTIFSASSPQALLPPATNITKGEQRVLVGGFHC